MNPKLNIVIGALIGAGVGYLAADWYIDNYVPVECDGGEVLTWPSKFEASTPSNVEKFEEKLEMSKKKAGPVVRNYTQFFDPKEKIRLEDLAEIYNREGIVVTTPEDEEQQIESIDSEEEVVEDEILDTPPDENAPHVISVQDYADGIGYSQTTLTYYEEEDVVTNSRGNPIRNPEKFLGEDSLLSFGQLSGDEDVVYVRNPDKKADYEILRSQIPYPGVRLGSSHPRPVNTNKEESDAEGDD
jgi:hypothetical protein